MSRRKKNTYLFVIIFLLATVLSGYSPSLPLLAQEPSAPPQPQSTPTAPLQRMRRVKGEPPKTPPARTQTSSGQNRASSDEDDEVVRVDTELANILLTAIDENQRFITTLRREDVRVFEDNVPQELSIFQRETDLPLTLAILVDTSRSQEHVLPDEKTAASTFINSVIRPDRDQAAIISFTGEALLEQPLTNELEKLLSAIDRIKIEFPKGSPECEGNVSPERELRCYTGVWDALWVTTNEVLSQTSERNRRAIILLSDGDDTSSTTKRQEAIDLAVKNNVVIYSIGIHDYGAEGDLADDALRKISERTGGRAFFPMDKAALEAAFAQIQAELRSQYLIAYQPANRKRDGSFRRVRIEIVNRELRKQKLRLLYRQGYYARNAPLNATPPVESRPK